MVRWKELMPLSAQRVLIRSKRGGHLELGIIGYGRFGRFAAAVLKKTLKVFVCDRKPLSPDEGVQTLPLAQVAKKPVLLLCVPISEIDTVCRQLRPFLQEGQLVLDTCSVKEKPLRRMKQVLPRGVEVLGTHPLFGPDSARSGIQGHRIVLCPGRGSHLQRVQGFLTRLGLDVIVTTAANHDRQMAHTQALFHFLARGVAQLKIKLGAISTPGPSRMFAEFQDVQQDSLQLFTDMQRQNRFSSPLRRRLIESLIRVDWELGRVDREPLITPRRKK